MCGGEEGEKLIHLIESRNYVTWSLSEFVVPLDKGRGVKSSRTSRTINLDPPLDMLLGGKNFFGSFSKS